MFTYKTTYNDQIYTIRTNVRPSNYPAYNSDKTAETIYSYEDYAHEIRERIRATNQLTKEHLKQKKEKAK